VLCCEKLQSVVSGLNRGLVASVDDLERAEVAAKELETAGGPVDLTDDLDKLQGKWRLLYSSAFSSRSLGGSRPGLPTGRLIPVTLGQVILESLLCFYPSRFGFSGKLLRSLCAWSSLSSIVLLEFEWG